MPDYAEMYRVLFRSQTKANEILQEAQRITEEMYISSRVPEIVDIDSRKDTETDSDEDKIQCQGYGCVVT